MIVAFIFLCILILLYIIIVFSNLRVNVKSLHIANYNECLDKECFDIEFNIKLSLYLFNFIKIFGITLTKEKIEKYKMYKKLYQKIKNANFEQIKKTAKIGFDKELIQNIKDLKIKIDKFDLDVKLGLTNPILTSFVVVIISSLFSYIIAKTIKKFKHEKYRYIIMPINTSKNLVKIDFNGIITVKLVHIINIIYILNKKRRVDNNERTSNRRLNGYGYEQYSRYGRRKYNYRGTN